ncbi:MAG: hypothetical protein KC609_24100, partial [Myxococcales bacterium]|nr:hypothetical protein [Myxococcales bacterium]
MNNRDVAAIFEEMAALTEILGGDPFRIRSFHRIAKVILSLGEPLSQLLSQGRLASYPGLGTGALNRIKQIQISGSCAEHQRLLQQIPRSVIGLLELRGVGTKLVRTLSQQLGIESVDELERDLANGASGRTAVLGVPTHEMLRSAVAHFRRSIAPLTIAEAETIGIELRDALATQPNVVQIQLAGSLRRGKELIGDLDLLVA